MAARTLPPFRADHVGSFLRPPALHEARAMATVGEIAADELREVEDAAIRDGNDLTYDEQVAKLALIVETAAEVWG
jgi:methionine synthase II (cobalamin-independent)